MAKKSAEAGPRGSDVRSDAWISVTRTSTGGPVVKLRSKVESLYGESIEELIHEGLAHFGFDHAVVEVEDQGALPFVLMARLEAAICRLEPTRDHAPWLPPSGPSRKPSDRRRPRRSRLYLPGNSPKFMINAAMHRPDGLILDLEDSVSPGEKDAARIIARNALRHLDFGGSEKMIRVNQGQHGIDDLPFIVPYGVDLILIPKIESREELQRFDEALREVKKGHGVSRPIWLMPIVESAKGAWFAYDIASASENIVALTIGLEDYTADLGVQRTVEGRESLWARQQVINGAKAAGVQAIDTVFSDVSDREGLLASVREAKALGFEGKGCIHPRQIAVVHDGFAPTSDEIAKAQQIVVAFEAAEKKGLGVVSMGSKMIDAPVVKRALHTIEQAERDGLVAKTWRKQFRVG
ncbi:MAG: aldolase/citrate lyase family protein [bacterium]